jgi:peptide/nickel transport system ATP-binding protein
VTAVERVSLSVHSSEVVGIAGPSGCGKSTLLRLLAGLERPDGGQLYYLGRPGWQKSRSDDCPFGVSGRLVRPFVKRRVRPVVYPRAGFVMPVFQDPFASVDPRWPIWRIVTEPLAVHGRRLSSRERRAVASDWLERAALGHLRPDARPGELSGGQCQRLALVRAMVAEPALIVADEPTARQDVITAAAMTRLLREAADQGVALAVVSHDETWLALLADHIYRLGPAASAADLPA